MSRNEMALLINALYGASLWVVYLAFGTLTSRVGVLRESVPGFDHSACLHGRSVEMTTTYIHVGDKKKQEMVPFRRRFIPLFLYPLLPFFLIILF